MPIAGTTAGTTADRVGDVGGVGGAASSAPAQPAQVFFDTVMVGNLDEKSLARCAIFTATWRATDL